MGGACCKGGAIELNPDGTPKDPQTPEQMKEDPKELRRAARAADWQQMRMLLRRMPVRQINSGASKDEGAEEEVGNTALHFAVSINHLRGVKKLLRYETSPHAKNAAGQTPLHLALDTGKVKAACILLTKAEALAKAQEGGKGKPPTPLINVQDRMGRTPLMLVVAAGRKLLAQRMIKECKDSIDYDIKDIEGNSLPLYAAKWGWFDYLEQWLEKVRLPEKLINVQNKDGETILGCVMLFAASGMLDKPRTEKLVSLILGKGALVKVPSFKERVPIINLAAASDNKPVYEQFILQGANPLAAKDALGRTPLHYAAAKGAAATAEDLMARGLKVYALDKQKNTPLHLAAMRGQEALVQMLLAKADDPVKALLTPNKDGLAAYHLALKAGPEDSAQQNSLNLIENLGGSYTAGVKGKKNLNRETPLTLAISGHQERVVKALLQKGVDVNERTATGELPLSRNLASATAATYDNDAQIFDLLINGGADMSLASESQHPLLAICRNNLSKFAEMAVKTLSEKAGGKLDWRKRDAKGYTPLCLAAFHDNVWLVKHLIDEAQIDPNAEDQRTQRTDPEVVGTTGAACFAKPITVPGTVEGQTPLMCAAKGASEGAMKLLLNRGASVSAVDALGRSALQHAMHLDKANTLSCAALLLQKGAKAEPCTDLVGEAWPHRAVRYGLPDFIEIWASFGGSLEILATTADDADDMPGAEVTEETKGDFLDYVPERKVAFVEEEDEELKDDYNGEDSEEVKQGEEDKEGSAPAANAGPVAEGVEDDGWNAEDEMAVLIATGQVETFYSGPTPRMMLRWRRRGAAWWDDFFVTSDRLPEEEDEDDVNWEDKYNMRTEGEEWVDEEDVMDEIWDKIRREQAAAAAAGRLRQTTQEEVNAAARGLASKIFRRRFPKAKVPDVTCLDKSDSGISASAASFAVGSPSLWLGRPKTAGSPPSGSPGGGSFSVRTGAGPVAEGVATDGESASGTPSYANGNGNGNGNGLFLLTDDGPDGADAIDASNLDQLLKQVARFGEDATMEGLITAGQKAALAKMRGGARAVAEADEGSSLLGDADVSAMPSDFVAAGAGKVSNMVASGTRSVKRAAHMKAMQLIKGCNPEKLWVNEPYYQPKTRYEGLPRYMKVPTEPHPPSHYDKYLSELQTRVATANVKNDALLEGPDLRERNITWYNKSMSPTEFPLKQGKWKAFLKKAKKAAEEARLRRPLKPGEKPKIRAKKVWFGIPNLPTRAELNATSPLVYAVRLCRAKCVQTILKYSASTNMPDGHGVTPISYALFLLTKERHNKALQQITDMLLAKRPLVYGPTIFKMFMLPRLKAEVARLEMGIQAREAKGHKITRSERKAFEEKKAVLEMQTASYTAKDYPSIMEPLILAALMNDIGRMTWMVRKCGANINDSFVFLPDIPTYFQGLWEKQLGRCLSRCLPLHVAICQKKYETIRQVLDLGADPNMNGSEYSGNLRKDIAKRAKEFKEKQAAARKMKEAAKSANPYTKVWGDKTSSLGAILMGMKNFIMSIEIPGFTRPHPWLSPLHLTCRFGLGDATFLLVKRGAAANGGPAAAFAKKSPLEEALAYARSNAQSYGTVAERFNYREILRRSYIEVESAELEAEAERALNAQKAKRAEIMEKVWERARKIEANAPKGSDGKPSVTAESLMLKVQLKLAPDGTLADFDPPSLKALAVPSENATCLGNRAAKLVGDLIGMIGDPTKAAMKAVAIAAKIIIKVVMEMMKRPIAHWDPALQAAHVLLYHRAPLNLGEKQTSILVRDIIDNGNCLDGGNRQSSYYRWLGLNVNTLSDDAWVNTVVNRLAVLKSNVKFGYMTLDTEMEPKKYDKAKNKFMTQVQSTILNTGSAAIMPAYFKDIIMGGMKPGADPRQALDAYFGRYVDTMYEKAEAKYKSYCEITDPKKKEEWRDRYSFGEEPEQPNRDKIAQGLLPAWYVEAINNPKPRGAAANNEEQGGEEAPADDGEGEPVAEAATGGALTEEGVKNLLVTQFMQFDPKKAKAKTFDPPPIKATIWDQLLDESKGDKLDFKWPEIDKAELAKKARGPEDLADADVCKAVVRVYTTERAAAAEKLSKELAELAKSYSREAAGALQQEVAAAAAAKDQLMAQSKGAIDSAAACGSVMVFDEDEVFKAAIDDVAWEAASKKLGKNGPALVAALRGAAEAGALPIGDPLEFAKSVGKEALSSPESALAAIEGVVGSKLDPRVIASVKRAVPLADDLANGDAMGKAEEMLDGGADKMWEAAGAKLGPEGAAVMNQLRAAVEAGELPEMGDVDPVDLAKELAAKAMEGGPDALMGMLDKKLGGKIPPALRDGLKDAMPGFTSGLKEAYGEGGVEGVFEQLGSIADGAMENAESKMEEMADQMEGMMDDPMAALEGGMEDGLDALSGSASKMLTKAIKMPKALTKALDSLPGPLKGMAKDAMNDAIKDLKGSAGEMVGDLLSDPEGTLDALGEKMDAIGEDIFGALDGDMGEMMDQLMAGMEMDLDVDLEAIQEALEEAADALIEIAEQCGLDLA